ncbi:carbon monoxide dehydrogenase [Streptomyces scabiei]|nr:carbon monoxide dehydrogenase [Streptomyces sp. LBUM 1484]MBP5868808.1 carbon monoxide dehydrogenase [Streptomyces sp. LBUM 1485]MBP5877275.1 carbon monoxide dehydrogenase [Streptomyces sp. LBUM 1477]MBP5885128.1 carbon monoxide dehydrogenase [Streptomyces sp. LBUM 1487]MBP5892081.1 carbon monoxide dehydrogenase [Streptomyces sp. LBUM 1481]MBP5901097.1 carbon monoxide dehydrogenase [Streptomyces sp. LBUM 1488]MBP5915269.1 carbon monoxide dehydrogenase [Streptomyces sp. LBUM 1486]MBP592231
MRCRATWVGSDSMEHEVFVPVPVGRLREALSDPERVARAVPGLQQDAGTAPVAGRIKVRVAGHTITYRGTLRVTARDDGSYAVEGDAAEARGTGTVRLALTLRLTPASEGTTLTCTGTATADGRITELPADAVASAATRLLGRFVENLATTAEPEPKPAETADEPHAPAESEPEPPSRAESEPEPPASVFDTDVPPSALDPFDEEDFVAGGEPPAEAAHARRTMIGRSAEEVDHAPPRGRYAPVPAPEPVSASATLRWAAPAAALAVASAIVVTRALRRRR